MEPNPPFIDKPFCESYHWYSSCGKSVVLRLIREELLRRGVSEDYIIYMNFESFEWIDMKEAKALYAHIRGKLRKPRENIISLGWDSGSYRLGKGSECLLVDWMMIFMWQVLIHVYYLPSFDLFGLEDTLPFTLWLYPLENIYYFMISRWQFLYPTVKRSFWNIFVWEDFRLFIRQTMIIMLSTK